MKAPNSPVQVQNGRECPHCVDSCELTDMYCPHCLGSGEVPDHSEAWQGECPACEAAQTKISEAKQSGGLVPIGKVLSEEEMGIHYDRRIGPVVWFGTPKPGFVYGEIPEGYALVPVAITDEMLRAALAVRWPATYREHLHHPLNGPISKAHSDAAIAEFAAQFAAVLKAAQTPQGFVDPDAACYEDYADA